MMALMCIAMLMESPGIEDVYLASGVPWWHRVTYMFGHANIVHLGVNVWSLLYIVFLFRVGLWMLLLGMLSASLVPIAFVSVPTVGLSGVIFFLLGSITSAVRGKPRYLANNLVLIIFGSFLPNIAWGIHLWCFGCGILYSLCVWMRK